MTKTRPSASSRTDHATSIRGARILVLIMSLAWGMNWVMSRITLNELPPWGSRFISLGGGTLVLFVIVWLGGRRLRIARRDWLHVAIASFFNVTAFNIFNLAALMAGNASRAVVIAYSMPIWSSLMAWLMLDERFDRIRALALLLCAAGLATLIWPLAQHGLPLSALYALGCALVWAAGTIYMKWARIDAEPMSLAAWQLLAGWVTIAAGMFVFEGLPSVGGLHASTIFALAYNGLIGFGLAYSLWFAIVERLPAMTASLGSLLVPVVGIVAAAAILGERPTVTDYVGFALIFAAAACVLLRPDIKHQEMPE
ncbi:MAG: DMT family transporter [Pseudolabrys sp.]